MLAVFAAQERLMRRALEIYPQVVPQGDGALGVLQRLALAIEIAADE